MERGAPLFGIWLALSADFPGFGLGVVGADGARLVFSSAGGLDGTTLPSEVTLYDASGKLRTGLQVNPSINSVGFFSGLYTVSGGKGSPLSVTGSTESSVGNAYDNSISYVSVYDSSGNFRDAIAYDPATNFNGFNSQDGAGHNLSLIGNALTTTATGEANESFMILSDTSGTERLAEFQDSTNEGGIDFNPGSTTVQGGWGNP